MQKGDQNQILPETGPFFDLLYEENLQINSTLRDKLRI